MNEFYKKYFRGERNQSFAFIVLGIVAMLIGAYLAYRFRTPFFYGIFLPFGLIGLLDIIVGAKVAMRTPAHLERIKNSLTYDPLKMQTEELPRMKKVMRRFFVLKWLEIFLLVLGAAFVYVYALHSFGKGFGTGLAIMVAINIILDSFAERRANVYLRTLKNPMAKSVITSKP